MSDEPSPESDEPARETAVRGVRLLAADPDLGEGLSEEELALAEQQIVLPTVALDPGPILLGALDAVPGVLGRVRGFLILTGLVTVNLRMSGRRCTRLIATRELVLLDGLETDSIPVSWEWAALEPVALALFDDRLLSIGQHWPVLMGTILKRAAQQTRKAFLQQAISQLPRVEERLLALFWAIADLQGVVRSDGVWVELAATHEVLAQMIGAQRPTVSIGLGRLAESGLLRAEEGGWLISQSSLEEFPLGGEEHSDDESEEPEPELAV